MVGFTADVPLKGLPTGMGPLQPADFSAAALAAIGPYAPQGIQGIQGIQGVQGPPYTPANGEIALAKLASGSAGQIPVANATGVPTYTDGAAQLGITSGGSVRRGVSSIATEETTTSTTFTTLTTPDQVASVVLPSNGLIFVAYQALAKNSNVAGEAAIFLGANQLKVQAGGGHASQKATISNTAHRSLASCASGLKYSTESGGHVSDVTTGQIIGASATSADCGACVLFAAAGTYTVSVKFLAAAGTTTVKERTLWVWTMGF